jgi:hypothetical protein
LIGAASDSVAQGKPARNDCHKTNRGGAVAVHLRRDNRHVCRVSQGILDRSADPTDVGEVIWRHRRSPLELGVGRSDLDLALVLSAYDRHGGAAAVQRTS